MTESSNDESPVVSAILAEFNALKAEIRARSNDQSLVVSLNITVVAVIGGFYFSEKADPRVLFLIPIISSLLGMRYVDHVINIDNLGRFIQREVKPQLSSVLGVTVPDYEIFAESFAELSRLRYFLLALPIASLFAGIPVSTLVLPFIVVKPQEWDAPFWGGALLSAVLLSVFSYFWFNVVRRASRVRPGPTNN